MEEPTKKRRLLEDLLENSPTHPPRTSDAFGVKLLPKIAEKEGFNVSQFEEGVWDILALAVEYKLRTLVDEALRICRRTLDRQSALCLDSPSVLLALKLLRWEQVPPASLRSNDHQTLDECMERDLSVPVPLLPCLSVKWVGVNGRIVDPQLVHNSLADREPAASWQLLPNVRAFKRDFIDAQSTSNKFVMSVIFRDHLPEEESSSRILTIPKGLVETLSEEQKLFLERIAVVLSAAIQETQMKVDDSRRAQTRVSLDKVIRSLSSGRIPQPLVPFILSLLCGEVPDVILDGTSEGVLILLDLLRALGQNVHIELNAYLHQILQAMFTCMLTPLIGGATAPAIHSAITVRRTAAEILAGIVTQSASTTGSVAAYASSVEILSDVLRKTSLPLPTLVGALLGAKALGPAAIKKAVVPVTRELIDALKLSLQETNTNAETAEIREHLKSSMLELLMACTNIVNSRVADATRNDSMQNLFL